jgi:putative methionine-R-sulfoxide reductase with GAF domain
MKKTEKMSRTPIISIRTRLLVLLVGITAIAIISLAAVAFVITQRASQDATRISSDALLEQAEDYLTQTNNQSIREIDLILENVAQQAKNMAEYMGQVHDHQTAFNNQAYWSADQKLALLPDGQYANSPDEISSVFVPNFQELTASVKQDAELSAFLDLTFQNSFESAPNIAAIYYASPRNVVRYFPNIDLGSALPADFKATERIWFTGSTPENNTDRKPWWTPTYADATGRGLVTTVAVPVYNNTNEFLGVVGFDYELAGLKTIIETTNFLKVGYAFLLDDQGQAIALPEQGYLDFFGKPGAEFDTVPDLKQSQAVFSKLVAGMQSGSNGMIVVDLPGGSLFVAYAPLGTTGWSMGSVVREGQILQSITSLELELTNTYENVVLSRALPAVLLILVTGVLLGMYLINRTVKPLQLLAEQAREIGNGVWDVELPVMRRDEIGYLAQSLQAMINQLRGSIQQLEHKVEERTRSLQANIEVSRRISTVLNQNDLVREVVELLKATFGYYHAHIYLFDDAQEYLLMAGGTGEAGLKLLERGHKIARGKGLVGRAADVKFAVLVADVAQDPNWLPNPLLPETRSELAVPILLGDRVLGVLDVQQNAAGALSDNDANLLQSIANQVAIALQNARSYERIERQAQRQEQAAAIFRKIQSATSIEAVLSTAARELGQVLGARQTRVEIGVASPQPNGVKQG